MPKFIPTLLLSLRRLAGLLAVIGCAFSSSTATAAGRSLDRWEHLRAQDLRVASIAYKLSVLNAGLCPNASAPQAGFALHSLEQYDLIDRQGAALRFRLAPSSVGVMAVVAGSPAQQSGLRADDQLVSVNGRALSVAQPAANAAPTRTAAFAQSMLEKEMAKGEVTLRVSRAGAFHDLRFTAKAGCASLVELVPGDEANAWADGQRVVVSDAMVALCATDGDLALVIAHELAHNLLRHSKGLAAARSPRHRLRTSGTGSARMQQAEEEADELGVRLASGASYDLSNALAFVAGLLDTDGPGTTAGTHPAPARRLALLKAEITAEILRL